MCVCVCSASRYISLSPINFSFHPRFHFCISGFLFAYVVIIYCLVLLLCILSLFCVSKFISDFLFLFSLFTLLMQLLFFSPYLLVFSLSRYLYFISIPCFHIHSWYSTSFFLFLVDVVIVCLLLLIHFLQFIHFSCLSFSQLVFLMLFSFLFCFNLLTFPVCISPYLYFCYFVFSFAYIPLAYLNFSLYIWPEFLFSSLLNPHFFQLIHFSFQYFTCILTSFFAHVHSIY